jgi:single-stranded-DNA-specific exonuclease
LPPDELPNAVEAGARLAIAAKQNRRIVIYGDYDVDGMTATAILWHCLRLAGANVDYYVPSRIDEGYGLNSNALRCLAADGAKLIITVDCGVTAVEQAALARELGVELIITDHHQPGPSLPDALIVHPTVGGPSANPDLSGSGVALKVAWALAQQLIGGERVSPEFRAYLLDATALAALGLVADVVPLTGENRTIASFGLKHLVHTRNVGLNALIEVSGLGGKRSYDDYDVGFRLAPRLNAIGRLGHAKAAVELFTTADDERAREIATELDQWNRERQDVQKQIVAQAEAMVVEQGFHRDSCRGIVMAHEQWHPGVVGIVASRLVERFGRPTVLIASCDGRAQGSGRSVPHFPLHEVLNACDRHLISHGGHAMAAGIRIDPKQIDAFTNAFLAEAANRLTPRDLIPKLRLDGEVGLGEMTTEIVEWLGRLAPHGPGNPRPRFASGVVELAEPPRTMGAGGAHLSFTVREGSAHRRAVAFYRGDDLQRIADQQRLRLAFEPIINEWNGRRSVELKVTDWKPA